MITLVNPQAVKSTHKSIKQEILNLLEWSELDYAEFQELQGYRYLSSEFGNDPFVNLLPYQSLFWKWWINHWLKRDATFLSTVKNYNLKLDNLRKGYEVHHNHTAMQFKPQSAILRQSYSIMIGNLIKAAQND